MPNHFLRSLQELDRAQIVPLLRNCQFEVGDVLSEPDQPPSIIAFPVTAQFSREFQTQDGATVETAWIGREGMTGALPILADAPSPWRITTRRAGSAWCIESESLRILMTRSADLRTAISRLALFYNAQESLSTACAANHDVTSRVARWLLTTWDEFRPAEVLVTQDEIARLLSTQRTSVVTAFGKLAELGATRTMRGRVTILDRRRLREAACSCVDELDRMADALRIPVEAESPASAA